MGVTLTSNYKEALSLDAGYGTFMRLRAKTAKAIMGEEYYIYESWLRTDERTPPDVLNKKCEAIYSKWEALWEFVSQSDCSGKLGYKHCGSLYELIKNSEEDFSFCYDDYYEDENKKDFINLLKGCYSHRANLIWD